MLRALILYVSGVGPSLTSTPNEIFEKIFHGRFIYSQSFCHKSAERKSRKNFFFIFRFDIWPWLCVNFIHHSRLNGVNRFLRTLFMAILFTLIVLARNLSYKTSGIELTSEAYDYIEASNCQCSFNRLHLKKKIKNIVLH